MEKEKKGQLNDEILNILSYLRDALFHRRFIDGKIPEYREAIQQGVYSLIAPDNAVSIIGSNIKRERAHRELHGLLTSAGIPYVIIKGWASSVYYPEPILRVLGDVDFLVDKKDILRTKELLEKNGYFNDVSNKEQLIHYHFLRDKVAYEMHWEVNGMPVDDNPIGKYLENMIPEAVFQDQMMLPSPFHHGIVILLHMAKHITTSGMGLRHLVDWAMYINGITPETEEKLLACCRECGLFQFAKMMTACCYRIGLPEKPWADAGNPELIDALLEDMVSSGNLGIKKETYADSVLVSGITSHKQSSGIFAQFFRTLTEVTCLHWPKARKYRCLIPIGWVYYSARYLVYSLTGKREKVQAKKIVSNANRRRAIYKELKLFEKA